jgi:transposase
MVHVQPRFGNRRGIALDRSTLADWVGHAAWHLHPLQERLLLRLKERSRLFADETTAPVLDPGRGCTKTGQLWAYAADDRPWGGCDPPGVVTFTHPIANPNGPLPTWRALREFFRSTAMPATASSPTAATSALHSAGRTFGVASMSSPSLVRHRSPAKRSNGLPDSTPSRKISGAEVPRSAERPSLKSRPLIDGLEPWLRAKLGLISQKSKLATAIRYALSRWEGLTRFIDDGRIELDNNTVERSIRPIALNRKNALFAGSDGGAEHWATVASLIETCKLNDIDPLAYLTDVLTRIVNGHSNRDIDKLLPWAYRQPDLQAVA